MRARAVRAEHSLTTVILIQLDATAPDASTTDTVTLSVLWGAVKTKGESERSTRIRATYPAASGVAATSRRDSELPIDVEAGAITCSDESGTMLELLDATVEAARPKDESQRTTSRRAVPESVNGAVPPTTSIATTLVSWPTVVNWSLIGKTRGAADTTAESRLEGV